ncbi:PAS domain-containing hybrid sensor histidine kinase/response regulator [Thermocoleostomius sinensis]|uniref:Circadian input-output histidine kinase CikA n=1 Tax=Thermocoleostomius sinensis A174 TaxID=2016057 RepID=A0A9E8ZCA6_9CYAN|nr:PAS domain-containing hybrid sensor histidine kinase/response regulator [Thermocoleostomius sinensis]WAL59217.1 PAS domain S-box protein [Thermocoleostomius sinensis A174]
MGSDWYELTTQLQGQLQAERERHAVLQAALEAMADGILVVTLQGRVLVYNQSFIQLWQIPESLLEPAVSPVDRNLALAAPVQDPAAFQARMLEILQQPAAGSHQLALQDGRMIEWYSQPQCLNEEVVCVWRFRDITACYRQQQHLNQLALAFQAATEGIAILDRQQRYIYLNEAHAKLFGYDRPESLVGQTWQILYEAAEIDRFEHEVIPAFSQQGYWQGEAIGRKRDGSLFNQAVSLTALEGGGLICIVRDISQQKQVEAERQQAEEHLKQQQQMLRTVIDTVPNIIFVKDWDGRYLLANQASAAFYNTTPETLVGQRDVDLHPNPAIAEQFVRENRRIIETGEEMFIAEERVSTVPDRDEWMQWQKRRIKIPGYDAYSVLGVGVRITDRKRQEAALRLIVEGTASKTGEEFFQTCVHYLAEALHVPYALLLEFCDVAKTRVRVLADHGDITVNPTKEYSVIGTPCQNACRDQMCFYPDRVQDWFPRSMGLLKRNTESYLGIPLTDADGEMVGHLVVMDTKPMQPDPGREMILRIFAARAGAELERRSAERAVQESERKFRSIFQNSQVGIGRSRIEDGLILEANQRLAEILGFDSADDLIGKVYTPSLYVNPEDRARSLSELDRAGGSHQDYELRLKRRDGTRLWGLLSLRLNATENCLEFVLTDISVRKHLEEELRQSQQLLNSIVENIPLALFTKDIRNDFRYVQVNKSSERIVGFSSDRAIGYNDHELLAADLADRYRAQDLAVVTQRSPLATYDEVFDPHTQDTIFVRGFKVPLFDSQGDPTYLLCIGEDISDRKHQEEALRLIVEGTASKIGDEFFRTCVRYLAEVLRVRYALITTFADEAKTMIRTLAVWAGDGIAENMEYAIEGTPCESVSFGEMCFYPRNIRALFPHCHSLVGFQAESFFGVPLVNSAGTVLGHLVVMDVEPMAPDAGREMILRIFAARASAELERKQSEAVLQLAKEQAEAANRAKSTFLANMSHELRTPLNAILGFAQLMERDASLSAQQRESLATINRSGAHLLNLINDVLEMSKIEAGRIVLNPKPFNLRHLLQTLREMFQMRAETKQLRLQFEIAPDVPSCIVGDEGKLRQVIINLLGNAMKFTNTGNVTLRVWTEAIDPAIDVAVDPTGYRAEQNPDLVNPLASSLWLHFEIEDTGTGIAPAEQARLFQPFVQTLSGAHVGGTGLGLAISRQFVQLMGGDLHFTSTVGQGSTFGFEIPVAAANPLTVETTQSSRRVLRLAANQPTYRILVADDHAENRNLLMQLLSSVGFETRITNNGQDAIALWQSWHPHLIWMDMRMPVMDGYTATRQIRSQVTGQSTVIIALTASAFEEDRTSVLEAGCDDFVRKPFYEPVIFEKMSEYLGVQYVYEPIAELGTALPMALVPADLTVMSWEWVAALRQAAIQVDAELIFQLIEQIPSSHSSVAERLTTLTQRFCFDEILDLTERSV